MKLHLASRILLLTLLSGLPIAGLLAAGIRSDEAVPVVSPDQMKYNPFKNRQRKPKTASQTHPSVKPVVVAPSAKAESSKAATTQKPASQSVAVASRPTAHLSSTSSKTTQSNGLVLPNTKLTRSSNNAVAPPLPKTGGSSSTSPIAFVPANGNVGVITRLPEVTETSIEPAATQKLSAKSTDLKKAVAKATPPNRLPALSEVVTSSAKKPAPAMVRLPPVKLETPHSIKVAQRLPAVTKNPATDSVPVVAPSQANKRSAKAQPIFPLGKSQPTLAKSETAQTKTTRPTQTKPLPTKVASTRAEIANPKSTKPKSTKPAPTKSQLPNERSSKLAVMQTLKKVDKSELVAKSTPSVPQPKTLGAPLSLTKPSAVRKPIPKSSTTLASAIPSNSGTIMTAPKQSAPFQSYRQPAATKPLPASNTVASLPSVDSFSKPSAAPTPTVKPTYNQAPTVAETTVESPRNVTPQTSSTKMVNFSPSPAAQKPAFNPAPIPRVAQIPSTPPAIPSSLISTPDRSNLSSTELIPLPSANPGSFPTGGLTKTQPKSNSNFLGYSSGPAVPPGGYGMVEGLYLKREGAPRSQSLNFRMPTYDYEQGLRATIGRRQDGTSGWEATFVANEIARSQQSLTSVGGNIQARLAPAGGLNFGNVSAFFNSTGQTQTNSSEMYSVEFNHVSYAWDVLKKSYGIRYIRLNEEMSFDSVNLGGDFGNWDMFSQNHLIGVQTGTEFYYDTGHRLSFSAKYQFGGYMNFHNGGSGLNNNNTTVIVSNDSDLSFSLLGEVGVNAYLQLTRHSRIRAGYELWGFWGLATIDKQLNGAISPSTGASFSSSDTAFLHGGTLGLEIFW